MFTQAVIPQLVDSSIQDRLYDKAVSCARALRAAAIQQRRPQDYNTLLMDTLLNKYKRDSAHGDFWMRLMSADDVAAPISNEECEGAGMSEAGAREFVRLHGAVADAGKAVVHALFWVVSSVGYNCLVQAIFGVQHHKTHPLLYAAVCNNSCFMLNCLPLISTTRRPAISCTYN